MTILQFVLLLAIGTSVALFGWFLLEVVMLAFDAACRRKDRR